VPVDVESLIEIYLPRDEVASLAPPFYAWVIAVVSPGALASVW
jgi:hypothetical protein